MQAQAANKHIHSCWRAVADAIAHLRVERSRPIRARERRRRLEELPELSHHSFIQHKLPSTGELILLLQIAPSKTDARRPEPHPAYAPGRLSRGFDRWMSSVIRAFRWAGSVRRGGGRAAAITRSPERWPRTGSDIRSRPVGPDRVMIVKTYFTVKTFCTHSC
jgi:hypothetical protein